MEVTVTATLDDGGLFASAQTVTVSVGAPGDSAEERADYTAVRDFTITIPGEFFFGYGQLHAGSNR